MAYSSLTSGIVKGATLDLGFGAAPQLAFHLLPVAAGDRQQMEKDVFRGHPGPGKGLAALCNPASLAQIKHFEQSFKMFDLCHGFYLWGGGLMRKRL